ncbi:URC4/urg3 family protein [Ramlibacter sp.]|uniref:URC4/urg3 family protein n=1 Tax=Ramlibacter sp. TaxID=1917967 RepID=UPI002C67E069|nr:URC4/urg3 family protein [Ramlibacter sp.]HWI80630.1 URC4/urg3 family protein [Ramlibacter sp.]
MNSTTLGSLEAEAEEAAARLRTTTAIRERAAQLLMRARDGESSWFVVDEGALDTAAREVADATRRRYPKLRIPLHSRWRHFEAGGVDRRAQLEQLLAHLPALARTHALIDLTVVSVLLDAGAGPDWKYVDAASGQTSTRSEGLAAASYHAFVGGLFSSDPKHPAQADGNGLRALVGDHLAAAFQVTESNAIPGFQDRVILLRRLGEVMLEEPEVFGAEARPAGLFDLVAAPFGAAVSPTAAVNAHDILSQLLYSLSPIWPNGNAIGQCPLGDCWRHAAVRGEGLSDGWMPLHKLSQWLTYSLIEPFAWGGVRVQHLDALTALPEYRNGGLLLDTGVLRLRDEAAAGEIWHAGDEIIVEWRALTVALMDEVAEGVRRELKMTPEQLPLACVLEGGSWAAGRELAQRRRGGLPPLNVASDGTVF